MMPMALLVAGEGEMLSGDPSTTAIFCVMSSAVDTGVALYVSDGLFSLAESMGLVLRGIDDLASGLFLIVLAFALSATYRELPTGISRSRSPSGSPWPKCSVSTWS